MQNKETIDTSLLEDLAPKAEVLVARHLETRKSWQPHEFVPWSLANDYPEDYEWQSSEFAMPEYIRSALFVNLLTEDNLPFYVRDIDEFAGKDGIWRHWTGIWTFEEGRHSYAMRSYIEATRAIDPVKLEQAREVQVTNGEVPKIDSTMDGFVYVALQELATRISHLNTAKKLREVSNFATDERTKIAANAGYVCLKRIATDENFHHLLYRDLVTESILIDSSKVIMAVHKQVMNFAMPGTGIPGFKEHAKNIANSGIYNSTIHFEDILMPIVVNKWKIGQLEGLNPEASKAQEEIMNRIERIRKIINKINSKNTI